MTKTPDFANIAAIMAEYGQKIDADSIKTKAEIQAETTKASRSNLSAGTLLIESLHHKHPPLMTKCANCKRTFMTNYCKDQYCSTECMVQAFEKRFHISWDRIQPPTSFWEYEESFRVSPDTVDGLYEWAQAFVRQYETGSLSVQEESQTETPDTEPLSEPVQTQSPEPENQTEDQSQPVDLWVDPFAQSGTSELPESQEEQGDASLTSLLQEPVELEWEGFSF